MRWQWFGWTVIALVLLAVVLLAVVLFAPEWMVNQYAGRLNRIEYSTLVDANRKTLAQVIGGIALFGGLYFTWRTTKATEDGRITDRFSKAVEQLGSIDKDGKKPIELRLGGIYALERIARDSKRDHGPIVSLLCAYVRENSPR